MIRVEQILWFCGIIVLRSPVFLIMTSSPFKVAAIISITVKERFTTKLKLIHGQHWHWLAASLSFKSCLDDQNGTLKKSFLEFFLLFAKTLIQWLAIFLKHCLTFRNCIQVSLLHFSRNFCFIFYIFYWDNSEPGTPLHLLAPPRCSGLCRVAIV